MRLKVKMRNFPIEIYNKLCQLKFLALNKSSFKLLSNSARLANPFRIDGSNGISINERSFFQRNLWLYCQGVDGVSANLTIGKDCVFGYNNHITCVRDVCIEDYVLTANNVFISDNYHEYEDIAKPIILQPVKFKRAVRIGKGAWIGENVSIIGASVGNNSVIGANSVVINDIPDYCVAVGAPAKVVRKFDFQLNKWIAETRGVKIL
jgi:acetyltransferase-like isoleucine patch superfamily enzyme